MSTPTSYQRVGDVATDPADYDWQNHVKYLRFDGSNDALVTNSIDFTATDKMSVFAGVRKLSDAAVGIALELGPSYVTNGGSFVVAAPGSTPSAYSLGLRGTSAAALYASAPAPTTNVISAGLDISGATVTDEIQLRNNAVLSTSVEAAGPAGTGNFRNSPLYLGARAGTSLYFNGRIYSLIVLGRTVTPTELTQTEGYVESKTFGKDMSYVYTDELLGPDGEQLLVTAGGEPLFMNERYE